MRLYMKIYILICIITLNYAWACEGSQEVKACMRDASKIRLIDALDLYSEITGDHVDIVAGIFSPNIVVPSSDLPVDERVHLIKEALAENDIGIYQIDEGRVVATWLTVVKNPARKYLNHMKKSGKPLGYYDMGAIQVNTELTEELCNLQSSKQEAKRKYMQILSRDAEYAKYMKMSRGPKSAEERVELTNIDTQ